MLASIFFRTNISQNYNFGTSSASPVPSPGPSGSPSTSLPVAAHAPPFRVGLWRVQSATHKVTSKRVSVWTFDKRAAESERSGAAAKVETIEILKVEASNLSRLRHPSILEMVEPLEETRSELIFATEPLLSSLRLSIPSSSTSTPLVELDEVEIQKGILQLCKGLSFLHASARMIHSNLSPESVLINASGDWKIGSLGLIASMGGSDGAATQIRPPIYDRGLPAYVQRSFDYMAPEYALEERMIAASDMYSLGCLIYSVHNKGQPPFKNHNNSATLRENTAKPLPGTERMEPDLRALLSSLIARQPQSRPTPSSLPSYPFFSSLSISTLNFLDRSNFASKSREEKISFMKGLTSVLERFSEGLRTRKILPSLLEEMKDPILLPYILPNVFVVATSLSPTQFATLVLPSLIPLFSVKDPPQSMVTLLDNLELLQKKTDKGIFREHVLPLVYNALECDHALVQERALGAVPNLCDTIDYAEVQGVLFPRVALVFTKTRILSVKVTTLQTFLAMVKTLDQISLTQKLVPLLSKIRTKEPAVMLATLAVQEAMGLKVDREAVATLVLPQLWTMSMGPLINLGQFQRFMDVIRKLGERVEREHIQHLRDAQRLEDRSAIGADNHSQPMHGGSLDFQTLVSGTNGSIKPDTIIANGNALQDDVWGSILDGNNGSTSRFGTPPISPNPQSLPSSPRPSTSSFAPTIRASPSNAARTLGTRPISSSTLNPSRVASPPPQFITLSPPQLIMQPPPPMQPNYFTSMQPGGLAARSPLQQPQSPNYNITLSPVMLGSSASPPSMTPMVAPNILTPMMPSTPLSPTQWGTGNPSSPKPNKAVWGDFDPLL